MAHLCGSNGANAKDFCKIIFDKTEYKIQTLASFNETEKLYKIGNEVVTKAKMNEYIAEFEAKKNVEFD